MNSITNNSITNYGQLHHTARAIEETPEASLKRQDRINQADNKEAIEGAEEIAQDESSQKDIRPVRQEKPRTPDLDRYVSEKKCTVNTDMVDREIEELKKSLEKLEKQAAREDNPDRQKNIEEKLRQVENQLRLKDTDSYRRQHSQFTES